MLNKIIKSNVIMLLDKSTLCLIELVSRVVGGWVFVWHSGLRDDFRLMSLNA